MDTLNTPLNQCMNRDVKIASLDDTWADVVSLLGHKGYEQAVLVDSKHRPLNIVTSLDLLSLSLPSGAHLSRARLADVRPSAKVVAIDENAKLIDAIYSMDVRRTDYLVIVDTANKVVGSISAAQVLRKIHQ